jgi:hypothetical protein
MNIIAIYPGRFQPFGNHHFKAFEVLEKKFGKGKTFIATSNVVNPPKSPFNFVEKKSIIDSYGIGDRVKLVKNPYKAVEILDKYDPAETAVVFMVGEKDMKEDPRFKTSATSYFQPLKGNEDKLEGYDKHGYLFVAPHVALAVPGYGEMSGTESRKALGNTKVSRTQKANVFKAVFGWEPKQNLKVSNMIFDTLEGLQESIFSKNWWSNTLALSEDEDPCWDGYRQYGMKKKGKKTVPNCVPVKEGYMSAKVQAKHNSKMEKLKKFLHTNIGREFVYNFEEYPKTVFGVPIEDLQEAVLRRLIKEGGAGGHMHHPFDIEWVKSGKDLVKAFQMSINYLQKGPASVKIDGVNASIRLIEVSGKKMFVMDRGSNKPLDVQGITKADLEARFGSGHGMIKIGGTVLDIFNEAIPDIAPFLKQLGMWDNPDIMFNIEYVSGSTNVLNYGRNFLAIHGLLQIKQISPTKRATSEFRYNKSTMQKLLNALAPTAKEYGYEVLGSVPTTLKGTPNLASELNKRYTVNYGDKEETKTLSQWLAKAAVPNVNVKLASGKTVSALSKEVFTKILNGTPLPELLANPTDYKSAIDGFVIYLATMKLGDAVLAKLDSPLGPVSEHEGIVIRDKSISKDPFKITGAFILGGLASSFNK